MPVWASPLTQDETGQAPPGVVWTVRSKECPLGIASAGVRGPSCFRACTGTARAELGQAQGWTSACAHLVAIAMQDFGLNLARFSHLSREFSMKHPDFKHKQLI